MIIDQRLILQDVPYKTLLLSISDNAATVVTVLGPVPHAADSEQPQADRPQPVLPAAAAA